ncbi:related to WHI3 - involved in regulation of cell size [Moesziomyces antarcticus]|nr:related to WHI3 - involved in regulation of cell size [Moesziomyces antarcticus]
MVYSAESRHPPPPGIFAPTPTSSSASTSGPPGLSPDSAGPSTSFKFPASPPLAHADHTPLAAPQPMQPFPRLTSPQPGAEPGSRSGGRSPSPTKRSFNFPMGDPSERWHSIGQASNNASRASNSTAQRKQSIHSGLTAANASAEPFLGYNELFSPNGSNLPASEASKSANAAALSTSDPMNVAFHSGSSADSRGFSLSSSHDQDVHPHRFGLSPGHYPASARDEGSQMGGHPRSIGHDDFGPRPSYAVGGPGGGAGAPPGMLGMPPSAGNLSPRSMMQLQHHHMQMQSQQHQHQAQQQLPPGLQHQQQSQQQQQQPPTQQQFGLQAGIGNAAGLAPPGGPAEEITTVFIVGFPDDMSEREFANMFLFAKGFEASTLKIPAGLGSAAPNGRMPDVNGPVPSGPGGPYQAVNMPGFDPTGGMAPGWEDQNLSLGLNRAGVNDAFSPLAGVPGMPNALGSANNQSAMAAGKIKQIIGFAKFRTRADALEARDALNGRKVDAEKGCVLKTEMAKKNLHTKQRPVLAAPGFPEGASGPLPPSSSVGGPPPPFAIGGPFDPRAGQQLNGPPSQAGPFGPFAKGPGGFEPFTANGPSTTPGDLLSPHEMFGGPDFFSPGNNPALRSSIGGASAMDHQARSTGPTTASQTQQQQSQGSIGPDKWGGSMGPIDYYGPESGPGPIGAPGRGLQGGPASSLQAQSGAQRPDWPAVGSPPPGLYSAAASAPRPPFARQGSRGVGPIGGATQDQGPATGAGATTSRSDEGSKAENNHSNSTASSTSQEDAQQQSASVVTRFGSLKLNSPPAGDDGPAAGGVRPPQQAPSPDLPSPTGRNVVGDNHPPVNTLFVGNLPSNASSAVLSQIEDQLRAVFSSCRGFRQFSFRLKSNGPMCFVEFEDVHTASKAMSELNGHSLGGAIKNGGIRLSFSKNPLFRMNSNSAMHSAANGVGGGNAGSTASQEGGANAPLSLGSASETLAATRR